VRRCGYFEGRQHIGDYVETLPDEWHLGEVRENR
jgi:hypothetical protein